MDVPKDQTSFLMGLLDRNIKTRLGASKHGHGFKSDIVSHPFLKNINWNLLDTKQYPTKFEPEFSASKVKESSADLKKGSVLSFESSKQYNMFTQSKASSTLSDINSLVNNSGSMPSIESREHIESNLLATCFHPYNSLVTNNSPVEMPSYFLRPKSVTPANRPSPSVPNIRHDNTGAA